MKKISNLCMVLLLVCSTFFVLNIQYTKEITRIQNLGTTPTSFDVYLKDVTEPSERVLEFLETLSNQYRVSIIKTDSNDSVVKSGVFDKETFPYSSFGVRSLDFPPDGSGIYSNDRSKDRLGSIPTFLQARRLTLQTLEQYFKDSSHTVNGRYTVTSTGDIDKDKILADWSRFFGLDEASLLTSPYKSSLEIVNRDLLLILVILVMALLMIVLVTVYHPIVEMKKVGVQKLLGFSNKKILLGFISSNLWVLLAGALLSHILVYFSVGYRPPSLFPMLLLAQIVLLQVYLLMSLVAYLMVQKITVASMVKGFSSFRIGLVFNYVMKILMVVLMAVLLIGVGNSLASANKELAYQQQWVSQGDYLTLENTRYSDSLWQENLAGSDRAQNYFYQFYQSLLAKTPVYYVRSAQLHPQKILSSQQRGQRELADYIQVLYANRNYLTSKGFPLPTSSQKKVILLPAAMRKEGDKSVTVAKTVSFLSLKYEDQQAKTLDDMDVDLVYYDGDWSFFPYDEEQSSNLHNPVISLVDDQNMFWEEKAVLSSTGLSSPIKLENTPENQEVIATAVAQLSDGTSLKFSSIQAIQQGKIDSYRDAVRNFNVLFGLMGLLSVLVSYFLMMSTFILKKKDLVTKKFLGWTFVDRYCFLLLAFFLVYLLPFLAVLVFAHSLLPIVLYLSFMVADLILLCWMAFGMERSNLDQYLKGGII